MAYGGRLKYVYIIVLRHIKSKSSRTWFLINVYVNFTCVCIVIAYSLKFAWGNAQNSMYFVIGHVPIWCLLQRFVSDNVPSSPSVLICDRNHWIIVNCSLTHAHTFWGERMLKRLHFPNHFPVYFIFKGHVMFKCDFVFKNVAYHKVGLRSLGYTAG
jgi:hypothetical protein